MNGQFAIVIDFTLDGEKKEIVLDTVDSNSVTSSSELATKPLVNGDITADHMIKQPITYSFGGIISNKEIKTIVVDKSGVNLSDVESIFERIQKEGILCNLVKIKVNEKNQNDIPQFSVRENLVLTSITWTENINSIGYSFDWNEVLLSDVVDYDVDAFDDNLPEVTEPKEYSFTDTLLDEESILKYFNKMLYDNELMTADFIDGLKSYGISSAVAGVAAIVAGVILSISSTGVGAIIAAAALAVFAAYTLVKGLVNWIKRTSTYKINTFKRYKSASKNEKEQKRYVELLESVHSALQGFNDSMKSYRFSYDGPQDCILAIDNEYYEFIIGRNNADNTYGLQFKKIDSETVLKSIPNIATCPTAVVDCNTSNAVIVTDTGYEVYLIRIESEDSGDSNPITDYYIMVTTLPMAKYNETLENLLKDFLLK